MSPVELFTQEIVNNFNAAHKANRTRAYWQNQMGVIEDVNLPKLENPIRSDSGQTMPTTLEATRDRKKKSKTLKCTRILLSEVSQKLSLDSQGEYGEVIRSRGTRELINLFKHLNKYEKNEFIRIFERSLYQIWRDNIRCLDTTVQKQRSAESAKQTLSFSFNSNSYHNRSFTSTQKMWREILNGSNLS